MLGTFLGKGCSIGHLDYITTVLIPIICRSTVIVTRLSIAMPVFFCYVWVDSSYWYMIQMPCMRYTSLQLVYSLSTSPDARATGILVIVLRGRVVSFCSFHIYYNKLRAMVSPSTKMQGPP